MALKPWYKVVPPREDLREGKPLDASEFAVHLDHIREGRAPKVYQDPECKFSVRMRHPFSPKMCHGLRPEPLAARGRSGGGGGCSEPWHAARSTIYGSA